MYHLLSEIKIITMFQELMVSPIKTLENFPNPCYNLVETINAVERFRRFPAMWEIVKVVFISKSCNDPHNCSNYIPISLVSIMRKISHAQLGFKKGLC